MYVWKMYHNGNFRGTFDELRTAIQATRREGQVFADKPMESGNAYLVLYGTNDAPNGQVAVLIRRKAY